MRLKSFACAAVVVVVLLTALELRDIAAFAGITLPRLPMPYGRSSIDNLLAVVLALFAALLLARAPRNIGRDLGLGWAGWRGPAITLLATLPCWIGYACLGALARDFTLRDLLFTALLFPLAEELVFRGFGFVFARRRLGWPLAVAVVVQAVAFGLMHWLSAGGGSGVAAQIFAITFIGGIVFALLDAMGRYTIWNGWIFHVSLNASWTVFAVSDSAASGWVPVILRVGSAILALGLVFLVDRKAANDRLVAG